jgi:hypothetical protein
MIQETRRYLIMAKKRLNFFKYSLNYKLSTKSMMNLKYDEELLFNPPSLTEGASRRQMNLIDFSSKSDFFLIDEFSDSSEFGGLTETKLEHHQEEGYLSVMTKFVKDKQGLVLPFDAMFGGFKCMHLFKREYYMYNGIRVTMRPPMHPCKVGIHIKMGISSDYEHFVVSSLLID